MEILTELQKENFLCALDCAYYEQYLLYLKSIDKLDRAFYKRSLKEISVLKKALQSGLYTDYQYERILDYFHGYAEDVRLIRCKFK